MEKEYGRIHALSVSVTDLDSNLKTEPEPYEGHGSNGAACQTLTVNGLVSAALQENAKQYKSTHRGSYLDE